ncbi:MAG: hypothetical protein ACK5GN_01445 [Pseudomonadota bacterium]
MQRENDPSKAGPRREEMNVGLARHEKQLDQNMPGWFLERGGWIFAGCLVLAALAVFFVTTDFDTGEPVDRRSLASLVVVGAPRTIWEDGSSTFVQSVQVRVGNQGQSQARDVKVSVVVGSNRMQLRGSDKIDSGKSEVFAGDARVLLRPGQELEFALECSNC